VIRAALEAALGLKFQGKKRRTFLPFNFGSDYLFYGLFLLGCCGAKEGALNQQTYLHGMTRSLGT